MMSSRLFTRMAIVLSLAGSLAYADLAENQVLILFNSANPQSQQVADHYLSVHPGALSFDFNNPSLRAGNISYSNFVSKVRDPLRAYLASQGLSQQVVALTLTKGLPHRIFDTDDSKVGDDTSIADGRSSLHEFNNGDATYASVDSELTLLWQNLNNGEAGGRMDSHADNLVANPYHAQTTPIDDYSRAGIQSQRSFANRADTAWEINSSPGNIYLTTRLDGHTVQQVIASINRAQNINFKSRKHALILDENDNRSLDGSEYDDLAFFDPKTEGVTLGYEGNDYDQTAAQWAGAYQQLFYDSGNTFIQGQTGSSGSNSPLVVTGPVAYLASFGTNHDNSINDNYTDTFAGQLVNGAIFNSLESFNARAFDGITGNKHQEQLADWIANGGTLGIGSVWEPFAASVADNEILLSNFLLNGMTWAEAAWSSIPFLSWQQIVIGDPLAKATLTGLHAPEPTTLLLLAPAALTLLRRRRP